mgnify:CR=1 FL=1
MIINNTNDALENLLLSDTNSVKLKITDYINAVFSVNEVDDTINLIFETITRAEDTGLKMISNKVHLIKYNKDLMNGNTFHNEIDFIIEKLEDLLNENFGIAPIGITKWKNTNWVKY